MQRAVRSTPLPLDRRIMDLIGTGDGSEVGGLSLKQLIGRLSGEDPALITDTVATLVVSGRLRRQPSPSPEAAPEYDELFLS